ncbi:MAG: aldo/keto reductase [Candidatus Promineifilaceae bacterium]
MSAFPLQKYIPAASRIAAGFMGMGGSWDHTPITEKHIKKAHKLIDAALESGINFFDHADIYMMNKSEQVFGCVLAERPELREQLFIQTKCGIRFADDEGDLTRYDFSKDWILSSVDGSLKRLNVEYIDILLLHRPDPLMEPEEIAEAFAILKKAGKVRYFGVSNFHLHQIGYLQSFLPDPLVANQIQLSLAHRDWIEQGIMFNNEKGKDLNFSPGILEYCIMNDVQVQAWGSMAHGIYSGQSVKKQPKAVKKTAELVASLANKYETSLEAIVVGWLLRHPAAIQPVVGTTKPGRIRACAQALNIELTREDWYSLFVTSRGEPVP